MEAIIERPKHLFFLVLVLIWLGMLGLLAPEIGKNFP
jgi:hypothetical protein